MHIPDNFLSPPVWGTLDAIAVPSVFWASRKAQQATEQNRLPLLGVMGAFVFAAQMINFPVGVGTSGHLLGGTLLACILGPWPATLVLTGVLLIQSLVFQDGGVLALGANIINMAMLGVWAGYLPARIGLASPKWRNWCIFAGGFLSVMTSGLLALSELEVSQFRISPSLAAFSVLLFAVNAAVEGALTVSVVKAVERIRPGMLANREWNATGKIVAPLAIASVLLASVFVLVASAKPDGLEHIASSLHVPYTVFGNSPLRNYQIASLGSTAVSRAAAGLAGITCAYLICAGAGLLLSRAKRTYPASH